MEILYFFCGVFCGFYVAWILFTTTLEDIIEEKIKKNNHEGL